MTRLFLSHRRAVLVLYGVCLMFTLVALGLSFANGPQSALLLAVVGLVVFVLMRKLGYLSLRLAGRMAAVRKKNLQLRTMVRSLNDSIARAATLSAIWDAVRPVAEMMDLSRLTLRIDAGAGEPLSFELTRPVGLATPLELPLKLNGGEAGVLGVLTLVWQNGRREIDRDEELALELLSDSVAKASARALSGSAAEDGGGKVVLLRR
jgi:UDP-GlcNAc:undecaprenyl-phosphate GlcNAc-1-phosphate transferase